MYCPWESYIVVFDLYCHTCVCERAWAVQIGGHCGYSVCTCSPFCACTLSLTRSLWLQRCTHWSPLWHIARICFWLSPNGGDTHRHHVGHLFSRLPCDGKEGLWLLENSNRRPALPLPFVPPYEGTPWDSQSSWERSAFSPLPPLANRNRKIWAILGSPFFPYLCQCPSCRFPLFPLL